MLAKLLQLFVVQCAISVANAIMCYACTTTLSSAVDSSGKLGLRLFLEDTYNLPKVHPLCHNPDDVMFRTIPRQDCGPHNECMKISAENAGIKFTIRGCSSKLFKSNVLPKNGQCEATSPSVCSCNTNACNAETRPIISALTLFISIFTMYLLK